MAIFVPTPEELEAKEARSYIRKYESGETFDLSHPSLHVSASNWRENHVIGLRVVPVLDLPLDRLLPSRHFADPEAENSGGCSAFSAACLS